MRAVLRILTTFALLAPTLAHAADDAVRVELNATETAESRCRMTFVIENKGAHIESLRLDFALFNTDGAVYRRLVADFAPVRKGKTVVKTFSTDGECKQLGAGLVNDVAACAPAEPIAHLDGLTLSSRVKGIRLYK